MNVLVDSITLPVGISGAMTSYRADFLHRRLSESGRSTLNSRFAQNVVMCLSESSRTSYMLQPTFIVDLVFVEIPCLDGICVNSCEDEPGLEQESRQGLPSRYPYALVTGEHYSRASRVDLMGADGAPPLH